MIARRSPIFAAILLLAAVMAVEPGASRQGDDTSARPSHVLDRVRVVGASVSRSLALACDLAEVLEATTAVEHDPVQSGAEVLFFSNPLRFGDRQAAWAIEDEPTLVVGVDFLFWFGYGLVNADGRPLASEEERLTLLEKGLSFLEPFECPLVVGDFPDMSEAIGLMLRAEQVPEPETLAALNARLQAWAEERGGVVVLPFARTVADLRSDEAFRIGRHEWPEGSSSRVLLPDRLHPTQEGLAAIVHLVAIELVGAGLAREEDFLLDVDGVLEALRTPSGEVR